MQKRWGVRNKKVCQSLILCYPICTSEKREAAETTDTEKYNSEYIFSTSHFHNHLSIKISYINTENWREYWSFFLTISRAIYEIFLRTDNLWIICLKWIDAHVFHFFCLLLQNTETKGKRSQWVVSFWTHKTVLDRLRYMSVWGTVCSTHRTHTFIL